MREIRGERERRRQRKREVNREKVDVCVQLNRLQCSGETRRERHEKIEREKQTEKNSLSERGE